MISAKTLPHRYFLASGIKYSPVLNLQRANDTSTPRILALLVRLSLRPVVATTRGCPLWGPADSGAREKLSEGLDHSLRRGEIMVDRLPGAEVLSTRPVGLTEPVQMDDPVQTRRGKHNGSGPAHYSSWTHGARGDSAWLRRYGCSQRPWASSLERRARERCPQSGTGRGH